MHQMHRRGRPGGTFAIISLLLAGTLVGVTPASAQEQTLTLLTHDSFALPDAAIASFEAEHDVHLEILRAGDAGAMVNQAILTADRPLGDVLYGVDNTFLSRALAADLFEPYESPALEAVPADLRLDPEHRVTPIDRADVCLNIDRSAFGNEGLPQPTSLEDLADPALAGQLVVENPATSSPGLAFLLATVAAFGDDPETGWQAYWRQLRDNDVLVTPGWEAAYYGSFSGASGEGDRAIVVSYATSPAAEVVFGADPEAEESPTAALDFGCFRQVEFAGILRGTAEPDLAAALVDFLLAPGTQAELPMAMFVLPARDDVPLPQAFERHALVPTAPLSLSPDAIASGRDRWISEWTDIVLR